MLNASVGEDMKAPQILIIDLRSQTTLLLPLRLAELKVRVAVFEPKKARAWLKVNKPKGIILSGGDGSVNDPEAVLPPPEILRLGIPILGICLGEQWLADERGGKVESLPEKSEYGSTEIEIRSDTIDSILFQGLPYSQTVWSSHGDSVTKVPPGSKIDALNREGTVIEAFSDPKAKIWAVQFHPEVEGAEHGSKILENFVFGICRCKKDWFPADIIKTKRAKIARSIGTDKAIIGFSGGVDSTTLAAIAHNVTGVLIDAGQLRKGEPEEVIENARYAGIPLIVVNARRRFEKALAGVVSLKMVRKIFSKLYIKILEEVAKEEGAKVLLQGTLAPDLIESGATGADLIKKHHNVDLKTWLRQVHPLSAFFKYEIRALARVIGLPESVQHRNPFPGPGLFLRILNAPVTRKRLELVRFATAEVEAILKEAKLAKQIDQVIVALIAVKTTGIKGDHRSHKYPIVVRTITSSDFMTARGFHLPEKVERKIAERLTKHPDIVRVWFDPTDKPSATVELQ